MPYWQMLTLMSNDELIKAIDDVLPQTQCGLCGYGGCKPYATAMVQEQAAIDACPPGGVKTLHKLATLLKQDATPLADGMREKQKPSMLASIRIDECIGCTKCIKACPVDAISGAAKQLHEIIASECTGCELCVEPCPMDCIDMIEFVDERSEQRATSTAHYQRERFQQREQRLAKATLKVRKHSPTKVDVKQQRRDYIAEAMARVQAKKK